MTHPASSEPVFRVVLAAWSKSQIHVEVGTLAGQHFVLDGNDRRAELIARYLVEGAQPYMARGSARTSATSAATWTACT